jgi:superfamily II RNA helicase
MTNNTQPQLPDEVVEEIKSDAKSYAQNFTFPDFWDEDNEEFALPVIEQVYEEISTEYATKLHALQQEYNKLNKVCGSSISHADDVGEKYLEARALLSKFISRHEAGLLPDRFIYNEIKTFLK